MTTGMVITWPGPVHETPTREQPMITALVQFKLPTSKSRDDVIDMFKDSAPKYREMPGLIRKYYVLSEDGHGGGMYLWESRKAAEDAYSPDWRRTIEARFGAPPTITYFEAPVVVDNLSGDVITDA